MPAELQQFSKPAESSELQSFRSFLQKTKERQQEIEQDLKEQEERFMKELNFCTLAWLDKQANITFTTEEEEQKVNENVIPEMSEQLLILPEELLEIHTEKRHQIWVTCNEILCNQIACYFMLGSLTFLFLLFLDFSFTIS